MEKNRIYEILEEQYFGSSPHEANELLGLSDIVPENIVRVLDVGASLGQYTRAFAKILKSGEIIAIEADPIRFDRLRDHCKDWQQQFGTEIRAVQGAACDKIGPISFFTTESNVSGAINELAERSSSWKEIHVDGVTLDELAADKNNTFVKMDIEGGEYGAMQGATQLLDGEQNVFLLEIHTWGDKKRNKTAIDVLSIFKQRNYAVKRYFGHYLFQRSEQPSNLKYIAIALLFRVKRVIYYLPFRPALVRFKNRLLKRLSGSATSGSVE